MTAPVTRYTKEIAALNGVIGRLQAVGADPDEIGAVMDAQDLLRQAAAEGQGNWEARWKALAVQAADAALQNYASVVPWGSHTLTVMAKIEEANPATPTEPTPPPVVGRCKTCKHWDTGRLQTTGILNGAVYSLCRNDEGGMDEVPADGSGFCHLHEATK